MLLLFSALLLAGPPQQLRDGLKWLQVDLYEQSPEDQAEWEANRYAANAVRLDLASVTLQELYSVQEAQANLHALPWLTFHLDARDDNTREARVTRFDADLFFRVAPFLWLAASGSPDILKDRGALGVGALLLSSDARRYLALRAVDDRPFYNGKNGIGAHRDDLVFRGLAEGRWEQGRASVWVRADLGTPSVIHLPAAQLEADERNDLDAHLRFAGPAALDLRVTARALQSADAVSSLRQGFVFARAAALVPLHPRWKLRLTALGVRELSRGVADSGPFSLSRSDAGVRGAALFSFTDEVRAEGGYAVVNTWLPGDVSWTDKLFISARYAPSARAYLRFLISKELHGGNFGGMNGELGVRF